MLIGNDVSKKHLLDFVILKITGLRQNNIAADPHPDQPLPTCIDYCTRGDDPRQDIALFKRISVNYLIPASVLCTDLALLQPSSLTAGTVLLASFVYVDSCEIVLVEEADRTILELDLDWARRSGNLAPSLRSNERFISLCAVLNKKTMNEVQC